MKDILVSINCVTYNHENYIADAIESFLMQQTNFKFEILIHDDASTDKTADIIREYEKKYPELIKPIYQSENQYSTKGVAVEIINVKRANGKYIAICEGDDYWTDSNKLQKQVDYLEKNPDCSLVFHAAEFVDVNKMSTGTTAKIAEENKIVNMDEISAKATPYFIPTASRMFRKRLMENPPNWFLNASVGDFPSALIIGNYGYFYYINEIMSAYRTGVPGSWTSRTFNGVDNIRKNIELNKEIIQIINDFDRYSNYQFKKELKNAKKERIITIIVFKMSTYFPKWLVTYIRKKVNITWIIKQVRRVF